MKGMGDALENLRMSNKWKESRDRIVVTCSVVFREEAALAGREVLRDQLHFAYGVKSSKGEKTYCTDLHWGMEKLQSEFGNRLDNSTKAVVSQQKPRKTCQGDLCGFPRFLTADFNPAQMGASGWSSGKDREEPSGAYPQQLEHCSVPRVSMRDCTQNNKGNVEGLSQETSMAGS